jgi:hypothetical protein
VELNIDDIVNDRGISTGHNDDQRAAATAAEFADHLITSPQSILGNRKASERITGPRISAGDEVHNVRQAELFGPCQSLLPCFEVPGIAGSGGQFDIQITLHFSHGEGFGCVQ